MATNHSYERALQAARLFVFSCCALATGTAAFAQSGANFRDASLMNVDSSARPAVQAPVKKSSVAQTPTFAKPAYAASPISAEQRVSNENKIVSVSATVPAARQKTTAKTNAVAKQKAVQKRAVRQTQYAEAPTNPRFGQLMPDLSLNSKFEDKCPDPHDMPSILDAPYKLVPSLGLFPKGCPLPDEEYRRKAPTPITFTWKASSLCYKPLYFEDVQLERYGHYCHPLLQPFASRVRFWLTIPCLPYLMGVNPPNECVYDLGYYRPGNCAPSMIEPIPISLRGGLLEAGAIVGAAAVLP